ncbi:hypothetical protein L6164_035887 [Bauhinia variegata]|uniref:Uncharacterized protein n=1 Tax=Bauhinia variegata TaxID=167791 RepID=A0ACB9KFH0_BAUVA|nr:hypothetical protein L6164_035887 [Bauhinia variegata]
MAKGRKLTTSRSDRYLGTYSYGQSQGSTTPDASEFGEGDVWSAMDDAGDRDDHAVNASYGEWSATDSNGSGSIRSRRRIPRENSHVSGLSSAFEDPGNGTTSSRILHQYRGHENMASPCGHQMATSAPVNVPDWSKILRGDSVESMHGMDDDFEDNESEMVPPHEYLAREYSRSRKMAANSVFEGVGRTLKGRDLRRVRDAVWRQTGFDG